MGADGQLRSYCLTSTRVFAEECAIGLLIIFEYNNEGSNRHSIGVLW